MNVVRLLSILGSTLSQMCCSYCEGIIRPALCRFLPTSTTCGKTEDGNPCLPWYDHSDNNADTTKRGWSYGVQDEFRGPRRSNIRWNRRTGRAGQGTSGGIWVSFLLLMKGHKHHFLDYWATTTQSRTIPPCRHQTTKRCSFVWTTRNWEDAVSKSRRSNTEHQLPESCLIGYRGQIHWWKCSRRTRNVRLCERPRAVCYLHGWNWCHWWPTILRRDECGSWNSADSHGSTQPFIDCGLSITHFNDSFWIKWTASTL